ncbi:MAG: NAD(P)H-dependent oxidoreductase [Candidatus Lokiarchaeota archaeon]|nr:NAD(P)H-dependent oxidoreductase [Candidatus Lokiarchaeota archaeon]
MSKILIAYYSLTGSTKFIAETLKDSIEADILELQPIKELNPEKGSRFMWGGAQSTMKKKPKLEPIEIDPLNYDLIIIGTPVWAWNFTPPIRSFLSMFDLAGKKVALWTCSAGAGNRAMDQFKKALKKSEVIGEIKFQFSFQNPLEQELTEYKLRAKAWALELLEKLN